VITTWQWLWQGIWMALASGLAVFLLLGLVALWSAMRQPPRKRRPF